MAEWRDAGVPLLEHTIHRESEVNGMVTIGAQPAEAHGQLLCRPTLKPDRNTFSEFSGFTAVVRS